MDELALVAAEVAALEEQLEDTEHGEMKHGDQESDDQLAVRAVIMPTMLVVHSTSQQRQQQHQPHEEPQHSVVSSRQAEGALRTPVATNIMPYTID